MVSSFKSQWDRSKGYGQRLFGAFFGHGQTHRNDSWPLPLSNKFKITTWAMVKSEYCFNPYVNHSMCCWICLNMCLCLLGAFATLYVCTWTQSNTTYVLTLMTISATLAWGIRVYVNSIQHDIRPDLNDYISDTGMGHMCVRELNPTRHTSWS